MTQDQLIAHINTLGEPELTKLIASMLDEFQPPLCSVAALITYTEADDPPDLNTGIIAAQIVARIKALQAETTSPETLCAAAAMQKPAKAIIAADIALVYSHFAVISTIATLAENAQQSAATFLIQHHDIDPETAFTQAALAQLASANTRAAITKYAAAWQKSQKT